MRYILFFLLSFLFSQDCMSFNSCDDCYDADCFWQPTEIIGEQCFDECMIADLSCYGETASWVAECPEETLSGYLRPIEASFCMDECSQYYIESETDSGFGSINVVPGNSSFNMDLYINRFVEVDLGSEITCVECSAFEIEQISLSDDCEIPVNCLVDPCSVAFPCEVNTVVDCVSNYCGGCHADFYDLDGNLVECISEVVSPCDDLGDIFFGLCDMYLGVAVVNGECEGVSGCGWTVDGIDYSDAFFNTTDECETSCLNESYLCEDIEYDYAQIHSGIYSDCNIDDDCLSVWGHCDVGLGGCHYSVNESMYNQNEINSLVDLWSENNCMEWVCDCMSLPDSFCNNGICDLGYCIDDNPAGCFSTGCSDNYGCVDYEETGDCVPSTCDCDEFSGWYCTEDCNGGTCFEYGDINYDSNINVSDVVSIVNMILGLADVGFLSDVNSDGTTNVGDVVALVNIILN